LLVDDVFTTGATMKEAARVLKEAGAKKIVGIVVAKASPGQDKLT
jgi:competence protein ComFC